MNPKLQFVQDNPLPNLPEGPITTATLTEFYDATIKQSLPKYEDVVKMHKMIVAYVKDPRAVFWIRDFASRVKPINDVCLHPRYNCTLRRGWLIEYLDSSFAFCDNSFSTIFYALAWHSKVYELDELIKEMSSKVFPYGKGRYRATLETEKQCYTTPIEIAGGVGQKHSHIYDLKKEYSFAHTYADYSTNFQVFYTRGRRDDYIKHGNYFSWKINTEIDSVFKSRLIAQFVRLIHPLNHFLTPLKEFHTSDQQLFGNDIGEDPRMLLFMKKKVRELYPDIIDEFLELAMATEENENDIDGNIPITYGLAVQNQAQTARRNRTRTRPIGQGIKPQITFREQSNLPTVLLNIFQEFSDNGIAPGACAKGVINYIHTDGQLNNQIINLTNKAWCKQNLKLNHACLCNANDADTARYYKRNNGVINMTPNTSYSVTNDWYRPTQSSPGAPHNIQYLYYWCEDVYSRGNNAV